MNMFDKAAETISGGHWDPCRRPDASDPKYDILTSYGYRHDYHRFETDMRRYRNRMERRVDGAVLGFPNSYKGGREHDNAVFLDYCTRGALREWSAFRFLGMPHPFKVQFADDMAMELHGVDVITFNDTICQSEEEAVEFLRACSEAWRKRGLHRRLWFAHVAPRLRRLRDWTENGPSYPVDVTAEWAVEQLIAARIQAAIPDAVPDGIVDGWPPDEVPTAWVEETSKVDA